MSDNKSYTPLSERVLATSHFPKNFRKSPCLSVSVLLIILAAFCQQSSMPSRRPSESLEALSSNKRLHRKLLHRQHQPLAFLLPKRRTMDKRPLMEIAEYASLAGSVLGTLVAAATHQMIYSTGPLALALCLNTFNRNRLRKYVTRIPPTVEEFIAVLK